MTFASVEEFDDEAEEDDKVEAGMTVEAFDSDELCKSTHFIPWKHLLAMLIVCGRTNLAMRCQKSLKKKTSNKYERQVQNLTVAAYLVGILAIDINNNYINIRPDIQRAMQECLLNVKLSTSPVKKQRHKRSVRSLLHFSASDQKLSTSKRQNGDFDWYNVKSRIEERETQREAQLVKKQGKIINGIGKRFHHIKKKSTSTRKQKTYPKKLTHAGGRTKIYRRRSENVRLKPLKASDTLVPHSLAYEKHEVTVKENGASEFYHPMLDASNILSPESGHFQQQNTPYRSRDGDFKKISSSNYKPYIEPPQKVNMENNVIPSGVYNSIEQKLEKRIVGDIKASNSKFPKTLPVDNPSSLYRSRKNDVTTVHVRWEGPIGIELGHGKKHRGGKYFDENGGGAKSVSALKDIYIILAINESNEALQELKIGNRLLYVNDFKIRSGMLFKDVTKRIRESARPLKLTFSRRVYV